MPDDFYPPLPPKDDGFSFDKLKIWLASQTVSFQKIITGTLQASMVLSSSNYSAGSAGWQIDGDGNAEFQSVTIRGTLNADDITAGTLAVARIGANSIDMSKIELTAALETSQEIRSSTFTAGSAGWQIKADGNAEFNNVVIRGDITANTGTLTDLTIDGRLEMSGAGRLATGADDERRMEFSPVASNVQRLEWFESDDTVVMSLRYQFDGAGDLANLDCAGGFFTVAADSFASARAGTITSTIFNRGTEADTGMWFPASDVVGISVGGQGGLEVAKQQLNAAVSTSTGVLRINNDNAVVGSTSGNHSIAADFRWDTGNAVSLSFDAVRTASGSDWETLSVGIRRITDATNQASLWFYGSNVGVGDSVPLYPLAVNGVLAAKPGSTGDAADAAWIAGSASYLTINHNTSARKYKSRITYNVDYLADIELKPAKFYRKDDKRWFYGLIADDLVEQDPLLGKYVDGELENYDDRKVIAVMAAKINRLEELVIQ